MLLWSSGGRLASASFHAQDFLPVPKWRKQCLGFLFRMGQKGLVMSAVAETDKGNVGRCSTDNFPPSLPHEGMGRLWTLCSWAPLLCPLFKVFDRFQSQLTPATWKCPCCDIRAVGTALVSPLLRFAVQAAASDLWKSCFESSLQCETSLPRTVLAVRISWALLHSQSCF